MVKYDTETMRARACPSLNDRAAHVDAGVLDLVYDSIDDDELRSQWRSILLDTIASGPPLEPGDIGGIARALAVVQRRLIGAETAEADKARRRSGLARGGGERICARREFGDFVRARREAKGISLTALAEMLGVTPNYVSMVERARVNQTPTAKLVLRLADALGGDPDGWLAMAGHVPSDVTEHILAQPELMPALIRAAAGLSDDALRRLISEAATER